MATKKKAATTTTRATRANDGKRVTSSRTEQLKKLGSPLAMSKPTMLTPSHNTWRRSLLKDAFPPSSTARGSAIAAAASRLQIAGVGEKTDAANEGKMSGIRTERTSLLDRLQLSRTQAGIENGAGSTTNAATLRSAAAPTATRRAEGTFLHGRQHNVTFARALEKPSAATTPVSMMFAETSHRGAAATRLQSHLPRPTSLLAHRVHTSRNFGAALSNKEADSSQNASQSILMNTDDNAAPAAARGPVSSSSSSFPSSAEQSSQSFDETLLGLEGLSFGLNGTKSNAKKKAEKERPSEKARKHEEEEASKDLQRSIEVAAELSNALETRLNTQLKVQDEAAKTAYQRIGQLVKGVSIISEEMHATFRSAVGQWEAFQTDIAELGDAMVTANTEILQQVEETTETIRDILSKMQEEKQTYEKQRSDLFQSFRKKAKDQFSKYEVDRDELLKVAAAVNDTKASEKQLRSTAMALIQSL
ncbi:hypothetical protein CF326_g1932 [Tilletia indica]|nr:hypothetical protein CF326_g1932 [Tilletia indica]